MTERWIECTLQLSADDLVTASPADWADRAQQVTAHVTRWLGLLPGYGLAVTDHGVVDTTTSPLVALEAAEEARDAAEDRLRRSQRLLAQVRGDDATLTELYRTAAAQAEAARRARDTAEQQAAADRQALAAQQRAYAALQAAYRQDVQRADGVYRTARDLHALLVPLVTGDGMDQQWLGGSGVDVAAIAQAMDALLDALGA